MKTPNSAANLIRAIKRYCGVNQDDIRLARAMADVIVGQMLPDGVVKGGSSLMFRYGGAVTRYTKDVDTARLVELEAYLESLRLKLAEGWNGFTWASLPGPQEVTVSCQHWPSTPPASASRLALPKMVGPPRSLAYTAGIQYPTLLAQWKSQPTLLAVIPHLVIRNVLPQSRVQHAPGDSPCLPTM